MYTTDDGQVEIEVRLEDENVWLTQKAMAELFDTTKQNISLHINNIFKENELNSDIEQILESHIQVEETNIEQILGTICKPIYPIFWGKGNYVQKLIKMPSIHKLC